MSELGNFLIFKYLDQETLFNLLKLRSKPISKPICHLLKYLNHQNQLPLFILDRHQLFKKYCRENDRIRLARLIAKHPINWGWNWEWNRGLKEACLGGHREIADLMIIKGATQFHWGLHYACLGGHREMVDLMIKNGVTLWDAGLRGACLGNHQELVDLMIEKGAISCSHCRKSIEKH